MICRCCTIPGTNTTRSWRRSLLMCCWIWFASTLLGIVESIFTEILACDFLFLQCLYMALIAGKCWLHKKSLGIFFLFNFWEEFFFCRAGGREEFKKHWHWFFLKYLVEFSTETVWFWVFLYWEIYISLLLVCSHFLFLHELVLICSMFLEIYPLLLGYPDCWILLFT